MFACESSGSPAMGAVGGDAGASLGGSSGETGSAGQAALGGASGLGTGSGGGGSASIAGGGSGGASQGGEGGQIVGFPNFEPTSDPDYDEQPLYVGDPPNHRADAPAETLNAMGHIGNVSVPALRRYPLDIGKATGIGYLVFPGGGYFILDMETHAAELAERVGPQGIAVFALKYRVGQGSNDAPRDALLDAKRAIRLVRENAARWGVDAARVGVIGYSAGSHLALNLAANFDAGTAGAADPIERHSSRPAFVGSMSTWAFGESASPFSFPQQVPPAFFCHAHDDDGAPIALAQAVEVQIKALGASTLLDFYDGGGHSTCHVGDPVPGRDWPDKFLPWLMTALP
jgi:predicted esterase